MGSNGTAQLDRSNIPLNAAPTDFSLSFYTVQQIRKDQKLPGKQGVWKYPQLSLYLYIYMVMAHFASLQDIWHSKTIKI